MNEIVEQHIQNKIYTIRGTQVMLDRDLAELYRVETKVLNRAVKRNIERFPETFRYQLNDIEYEEILRFQNGTSSSHDRFMIIDETEVYHIGASLKDLGKKWFAFSRMEKENLKILERLT